MWLNQHEKLEKLIIRIRKSACVGNLKPLSQLKSLEIFTGELSGIPLNIERISLNKVKIPSFAMFHDLPFLQSLTLNQIEPSENKATGLRLCSPFLSYLLLHSFSNADFVYDFISPLKSLKSLHLHSCEGFSVKRMQELFKNLSVLENCSIFGCNLYSEDFLLFGLESSIDLKIENKLEKQFRACGFSRGIELSFKHTEKISQWKEEFSKMK